jgi:hypothetical protein
MKTIYITFKREMARAYAEGQKKMTRRVLKVIKQGGKMGHPEPPWQVEEDGKLYYQDEYGDYHPAEDFCPYGQPGDQLILGTTWATLKKYDNRKPSDLPAEEMQPSTPGFVIRWDPIPIWSYFNSDEKPEGFGKLRPGRFLPGFLRGRMPRETLKIVRAERVQDITNDEAILEGIFETSMELEFDCWSTYGMREYCPTPRDAFRALWDSINAGRGYSWDSNPWVWVLGW